MCPLQCDFADSPSARQTLSPPRIRAETQHALCWVLPECGAMGSWDCPTDAPHPESLTIAQQGRPH